MKILIIGATTKTAGIGGVAIHVERLLEALKKRNFLVYHEDYKQSWLRPLIKSLFADVIHIHVQNKIYTFLLVSISKLCRTKTIYTLHQNYVVSKAFQWKLCDWIFKLSDVVIVLNSQSQNRIKRHLGIDTILLPAYIQPTKIYKLDDKISKMISFIRKRNFTICCTNAARFTCENGREVYGISFLCQKFKQMNNYYLIISDPSGECYNNIKCTSNNIIFITYPHSYYALLKVADISIRYTSTDGDALSVKESLSLGLPTICTDCVDRPEGVILCKFNNNNSFEKALIKATKVGKHPMNFDDPIDRLINIYTSLK